MKGVDDYKTNAAQPIEDEARAALVANRANREGTPPVSKALWGVPFADTIRRLSSHRFPGDFT